MSFVYKFLKNIRAECTGKEENLPMEQQRTTLSSLFWAFVRIGALTFGGGYAMLPMLERECMEKHNWATKEELLDYFAIAQCTPGIIAINTATFIGAKFRGAIGAAAATLGVVFPSLVIILLIASILDQFAHYPAVAHAFGGIRVAVAVLVINSVLRLVRNNVKGTMGISLCVISFVLVAFLSLSPAIVVLAAAAVGLISAFVGGGRKKA